MVLVDPPYGITKIKWDLSIAYDDMWKQLKRISKNNIAIVIFGQEPFSSKLRLSNLEMFKYDWYWKKSRPSGFTNAKLKPLKDIEIISVFSTGSTANGSVRNMPYNPQDIVEVNQSWSRPKIYYGIDKDVNPTRKNSKLERVMKFKNYPRQILEYPNSNANLFHPTQKPVELCEYLIKTYSRKEDVVLDFTMGSGTTGVACMNTDRKFIGIEKEEKYFEISKQRILNCA